MLTLLRSALGRPLRWTQRGWLRPTYELRAGNDVVATLEHAGFLRRTATARTADDRWTLEARGFLAGRLVVRHGDSDSEDAVLTPHVLTGSGTVRFHDGRTFRWKREDFWATRWAMQDEAGAPLYHLKRDFPSILDQGEVTLAAGAERNPALPVLLSLGWFAFLTRPRRSRG